MRITVASLVVLFTCVACAQAPEPAFDDSFRQHWSDGQAELAGYELTFPRYGELRQESAVTIVCPETFARMPA